MDTLMIITGIAILAAGTWLMRYSGAALGNRLTFSERAQSLLTDAATTLLFSVSLAATIYESGHFAGMARMTGVLVAVFLAWRKAPLIAVIVVAAAVTAGLRYLGLR